jgi:hypothetical protein
MFIRLHEKLQQSSQKRSEAHEKRAQRKIKSKISSELIDAIWHDDLETVVKIISEHGHDPEVINYIHHSAFPLATFGITKHRTS